MLQIHLVRLLFGAQIETSGLPIAVREVKAHAFQKDLHAVLQSLLLLFGKLVQLLRRDAQVSHQFAPNGLLNLLPDQVE